MIDSATVVANFLRQAPGISFQVFASHRPRNVNDCITVVADGGVVVGEYMGLQDVIRKNMLIIYIRSTNYPSAVKEAGSVANAMKTFAATAAPNGAEVVYGIRPVGGLEPLGVDDLNRHEVSLSYNLYVKE